MADIFEYLSLVTSVVPPSQKKRKASKPATSNQSKRIRIEATDTGEQGARTRVGATGETRVAEEALVAPTTSRIRIRSSRIPPPSGAPILPRPVNDTSRSLATNESDLHEVKWNVHVSDRASNTSVASEMVRHIPTPADFERISSKSLTDVISRLNVLAIETVTCLSVIPGSIARMASDETVARERADGAEQRENKLQEKIEMLQEKVVVLESDLDKVTEKKKAQREKFDKLKQSWRAEFDKRDADLDAAEKACHEAETALQELQASFNSKLEDGRREAVVSFKASNDYKLAMKKEGFFAFWLAIKESRKLLLQKGMDPSVLAPFLPQLEGRDGQTETKEEILAAYQSAEERVTGVAPDESEEESDEDGDDDDDDDDVVVLVEPVAPSEVPMSDPTLPTVVPASEIYPSMDVDKP